MESINHSAKRATGTSDSGDGKLFDPRGFAPESPATRQLLVSKQHRAGDRLLLVKAMLGLGRVWQRIATDWLKEIQVGIHGIRTKRPSMALVAIGVPAVLFTAILAGRMLWEETFLTFQQGPQMLGFSLFSTVAPLG
jgi:hypothetical protein